MTKAHHKHIGETIFQYMYKLSKEVLCHIFDNDRIDAYNQFIAGLVMNTFTKLEQQFVMALIF